jgi:hypothetical protein
MPTAKKSKKMPYNYFERQTSRARKFVLPGDLENGRYLTDQDVCNRLNNTIAFWKGIPVRTIPVGQNRVRVCDFISKVGIDYKTFDVIDANSPDLSTEMLDDIGYINRGDQALYITRAHWRKTFAGISPESCFFTPAGSSDRIGCGNWLPSQELYNALLNIYPTLSECIDATKNRRGTSKAFTKSFAVYEGYTLYHETYLVGYISKEAEGNAKVVLCEGFKDSVFSMSLRQLGIEV